MCKLDNELDNYILQLFSQETDLFNESYYEVCKYKLWDILGCFHYILNAPRMLCLITSVNKIIMSLQVVIFLK